VKWFRSSSPYINAHRNKTFVIAFGGEAVLDSNFNNVIHDIALLNSLGIKLILVHGARPQINDRLALAGLKSTIAQDLRVTDAPTLECVQESVGKVKSHIEALLSMGIANSPMHGAAIRVCSGNFVTARPYGIRNGTDFHYTGEIRKVDSEAINEFLSKQFLVLISPIGYSPTGEIFNLAWEEVAEAVAVRLKADKLIYLGRGQGIPDGHGQLITEITAEEALADIKSGNITGNDVIRKVNGACRACRAGVERCHIISSNEDGALLGELFSRDGAGTLITRQSFEQVRTATIEDVGGIQELLEPLEQEHILVRRPRELLENEITQFTVIERDGMIIGCAALYPFTEDKIGELACVTIHQDYRNNQKGDLLLTHIEKRARSLGLQSLFVLTTRTTHWFRERGFVETDIKSLPHPRQSLYNYQRKSKVFKKTI